MEPYCIKGKWYTHSDEDGEVEHDSLETAQHYADARNEETYIAHSGRDDEGMI